jgi:sRNA-binding regulator protein Hfq
MKDAVEAVPAERPMEQEGFANRKLIRPSLTRNDHNHLTHNHSSQNNHAASAGERRERPERQERPDRGDRGGSMGGKKSAPPEQTNAENFYYLKQMQSKTSMSIVLRDGEILKGVIEWYDKDCLKVNREGAPNLLVFKSNIKYMHKA